MIAADARVVSIVQLMFCCIFLKILLGVLEPTVRGRKGANRRARACEEGYQYQGGLNHESV